jgi:hypothetical protein
MIEEVEELFQRQLRVWPRLAHGVEGLARAQTRSAQVDGCEILIRLIPHRIGSTTAAVDRESVAHRPCFLCAENLPAEEEGLPFGTDFTLYCNPFPIVDRHLTITHRSHIAQGIAPHFETMLDLAVALPGYFIIYNGPECGASAPDHMHFQAGLRSQLPIERVTAGLLGPTVPNYVRRTLLFRSRDRSFVVDRVEAAMESLRLTTGKTGEPLINIASLYDREEWVTYLFPRRKHRPEVFHSGELTVSPAAIDFCGIFVVPLESDFLKITGEAIAAIFHEVVLPEDQFNEVVARLGYAA